MMSLLGLLIFKPDIAIPYLHVHVHSIEKLTQHIPWLGRSRTGLRWQAYFGAPAGCGGPSNGRAVDHGQRGELCGPRAAPEEYAGGYRSQPTGPCELFRHEKRQKK